MKWRPYSRVVGSRVYVWSLSFVCLATVTVGLGCGFKPKFDTPDATVQTYIWGYNHGDQNLMKKCGYDADLYKLFRVTIDVGIGKPEYQPVRDIQAELLTKEWARPKTTRKYTSDRALLSYDFKSESDPTFHVRAKLLLVKRRNTYMDFADPIRWQLMTLENARAEAAESQGTPFD
ncbi:MAG: hypothetical protein JW759_10335 [Candidatus Coatesbacteria bacterium]|nr:hypothetical protein [Candidatus Coatesbacteria bacterium]